MKKDLDPSGETGEAAAWVLPEDLRDAVDCMAAACRYAIASKPERPMVGAVYTLQVLERVLAGSADAPPPASRQEIREALERMEWAGGGRGFNCPSCGGYRRYGHTEKCGLKKAIASLTSEASAVTEGNRPDPNPLPPAPGSGELGEAAAILKLLADGEDMAEFRADARRLAKSLFSLRSTPKQAGEAREIAVILDNVIKDPENKYDEQRWDAIYGKLLQWIVEKGAAPSAPGGEGL